MSPRLTRALKWSGIAVAVLLAALCLLLALMDAKHLKRSLEHLASARSGRAVTIAGELHVHWSLTPEVTLDGLTVANPPWESARPLAQIEHVHLKVKLLPLLWGEVVMPRVELIRPDIYLHRERSGRANWSFENQAPSNARAEAPLKLPAIQDFLIESGKLHLTDDIRRLKLEGTIGARERGSQEDPQAFRIVGHGTLNEEPFAVRVSGGPLLNLNPRHPYSFDLDLSAGHVHIESSGVIRRPFDFGQLQLDVRASGQDLAELYYLTQIALPNTPPYKIHGHIERDGARIRLTDLDGTLGSSDVSGTLEVDASRKRPFLSGELKSRRMALADLAASVGGRAGAGLQPAGGKGATRAMPVRHSRDPSERLFPDAHLQVERVRGMDARVRYQAHSVQAGSVPMKEVDLDIRLEEGVLSLEPFAFELQQGRLAGTAHIDARQSPPLVHLDVRMKDIQLAQLKGKAPDAKAPFSGVMQARAVTDGRGDSLHQVMASANGTFTAILPQGEANAALTELTGINVINGLGLLLKNPDDREPIRCGVAQFQIGQGVMHAQTVIFDTKDVRISGRGDVRLGPEELDLSVRGQPKKLRLARLRSPIEVGGHILDPKIGINVGESAKQGALAAALGSALSPLAAVLAFVDPGLAKDENCAALLGAARSGETAPPQGQDVPAGDKPAPPQAAPREH